MKEGRRNSPTTYISMQVIPAAPGYSVISPCCDTDRPEVVTKYSLDAIIGWALDRESLQPYPITLFGVHEDTPSVLKPDGTVDRLGMESYDNIEQWIADLKRCSVESNT